MISVLTCTMEKRNSSLLPYQTGQSIRFIEGRKPRDKKTSLYNSLNKFICNLFEGIEHMHASTNIKISLKSINNNKKKPPTRQIKLAMKPSEKYQFRNHQSQHKTSRTVQYRKTKTNKQKNKQTSPSSWKEIKSTFHRKRQEKKEKQNHRGEKNLCLSCDDFFPSLRRGRNISPSNSGANAKGVLSHRRPSPQDSSQLLAHSPGAVVVAKMARVDPSNPSKDAHFYRGARVHLGPGPPEAGPPRW